jgi:general secretion pathway protein G
MLPENDMPQNLRKNERGFTLIEIMVVVVIIGLLATLVTVNLLENADKAKVVKARADIKALENALELYKLDSGRYPNTQEGVKALVTKTESHDSYIKGGSVPKDPWGKEYVYLSPGSHGDFDILSYGADGEPGGAGTNADITSWTPEAGAAK